MIWKIQIKSYVQKVIPTFTKKNRLFISFSDNGRDNEKVGITIETLHSISPSTNTTIWSVDSGWLANDLYIHFNVPQASEK